MPLFFIVFIVFVIWFRVKMHQNNSDTDARNDAFWAREEQANFARARDISTLNYLSVSEDDLPFSSPSTQPDERGAALEERVRETSQRKMINLSAYSNTDLKEQYGIVHLEELSNCDQNFLFFIRALANWGTYLYEQENFSSAKQVMEYSKSIGSDISTVYTTLGNIYAREGCLEKVDQLIADVENSNFALKTSILRQLKLCKLEN